jgi:hypothetical protein
MIDKKEIFDQNGSLVGFEFDGKTYDRHLTGYVSPLEDSYNLARKHHTIGLSREDGMSSEEYLAIQQRMLREYGGRSEAEDDFQTKLLRREYLKGRRKAEKVGF